MIQTLFAVILIQQVWHHYTIQKLINKLMSRNYHEYQLAENVNKSLNSENKFISSADGDIPEDLGVLQGFG